MGTTENIQAWSTTAATNASADTAINWAEGQDAASVNNSARSMMAAVAKHVDDTGGFLAAAGSGDALTVTTQQGLSAAHLTAGLRLLIQAAASNTTIAPTLAVDGLSPLTIRRADGTPMAPGDIRPGLILDLMYNIGDSSWKAINLSGRGASVASFSAHNNGVAQAIPSATLAKLSFSTVDLNIGNFYSTGTNRFTPPAGTALITASVYCPGGDFTVISIVLFKNGGIYKYGSQITVSTPSGQNIQATGTWISPCSGSDYFEIYAIQNSGSNQNVAGSAANTYFQGTSI